MRGRGKEGQPLKWTGAVRRRKCVVEANPNNSGMIAVTSGGNSTKVIDPYAAKKSLYPDLPLLVPHTDTGRQGELSPGDRVTLCQGTRQINPVPSEKGVPE